MSLYPESYQIPAMKYCSKPSQTVVEQVFSTNDWLAQEKKDGALYQLEKTPSGYVYLFGRSKSKKTGELTEKSDNFPHIKKWAEEYLPCGTILLGEIYVVGGHSNDVTKLSGCLAKNAVARQFNSDAYGGPVHYYIFDCITYAGQELINKGTEERLSYLTSDEMQAAVSKNDYVEIAHTYYTDFEKELQKIFAAGGEGMVFKKKTCPYRPGMRSTTNQMFKYKQHLDSIDLICIGLEDPEYLYTGKEQDTWPYRDGDGNLITKPAFFGWKNSMSLGCFKGDEIVYVGRVASGLTDAMREDMSKHPEHYLSKVVQISCMSVNSKDGTIRHPVFEQMRTDKDIEDCTFDSIF